MEVELKWKVTSQKWEPVYKFPTKEEASLVLPFLATKSLYSSDLILL
jgi:hypothetical protein